MLFNITQQESLLNYNESKTSCHYRGQDNLYVLGCVSETTVFLCISLSDCGGVFKVVWIIRVCSGAFLRCQTFIVCLSGYIVDHVQQNSVLFCVLSRVCCGFKFLSSCWQSAADQVRRCLLER